MKPKTTQKQRSKPTRRRVDSARRRRILCPLRIPRGTRIVNVQMVGDE